MTNASHAPPGLPGVGLGVDSCVASVDGSRASALFGSLRLELLAELSALPGSSLDSAGLVVTSCSHDTRLPWRAFVLTASLFERFASRGEDEFRKKVLSTMRSGFGGHVEKKK